MKIFSTDSKKIMTRKKCFTHFKEKAVEKLRRIKIQMSAWNHVWRWYFDNHMMRLQISVSTTMWAPGVQLHNSYDEILRRDCKPHNVISSTNLKTKFEWPLIARASWRQTSNLGVNSELVPAVSLVLSLLVSSDTDSGCNWFQRIRLRLFCAFSNFFTSTSPPKFVSPEKRQTFNPVNK